MALKFGLVGLGHWGPNLLRNFMDHPDVQVEWVCDLDSAKLAKISRQDVQVTDNIDTLFAANLDAVVVATPVSTHYEIARRALSAGMHVFVEKPLASSVDQCERLMALAAANELQLMVGHVFLYNNGIRYVKSLIDSGELGDIACIHSQRTNLGPVRQDVNAFWDLAAHDISIFNYWLGQAPTAVNAFGSRILNDEREDVVHANLVYPDNVACQVLVSWLHPLKTRQITVVGARKMVVWDDMATSGPVRIYDKNIDIDDAYDQREGTYAEFTFTIREGDVTIPRIPAAEPLRNECNDFITAIVEKRPPLSDGQSGLDVVRALVATDESQADHSRLIRIGSDGK